MRKIHFLGFHISIERKKRLSDYWTCLCMIAIHLKRLIYKYFKKFSIELSKKVEGRANATIRCTLSLMIYHSVQFRSKCFTFHLTRYWTCWNLNRPTVWLFSSTKLAYICASPQTMSIYIYTRTYVAPGCLSLIGHARNSQQLILEKMINYSLWCDYKFRRIIANSESKQQN